MNIMDLVHYANEAALNSGYDQVMYEDDNELCFSRDYSDNNMYKKENILGYIRTYWENGILKTRVTSR